MPDYSPEKLKQVFQKLGYTWFEDKPNFIGIRSTNVKPDVFNDVFVAVWKQPEIQNLGLMNVLQRQVTLNKWLYVGENGKALTEDGQDGRNTKSAVVDHVRTVGQYRSRIWTITTLPGVDFLLKPENPKGTAVFKPGQYIDAYSIGLHKQKKDHPALVQSGEISVYRDKDSDKLPEETASVDTGKFGCNIHRSNSKGVTQRIGKWSAGCQVFQVKTDHDLLMRLANAYKGIGVNKFTYTLIKESDL